MLIQWVSGGGHKHHLFCATRSWATLHLFPPETENEGQAVTKDDGWELNALLQLQNLP